MYKNQFKALSKNHDESRAANKNKVMIKNQSAKLSTILKNSQKMTNFCKKFQ